MQCNEMINIHFICQCSALCCSRISIQGLLASKVKVNSIIYTQVIKTHFLSTQPAITCHYDDQGINV